MDMPEKELPLSEKIKECQEKGINFLLADADKSNECKCVIEDGNIRLSLYAMDND